MSMQIEIEDHTARLFYNGNVKINKNEHEFIAILSVFGKSGPVELDAIEWIEKEPKDINLVERRIFRLLETIIKKELKNANN